MKCYAIGPKITTNKYYNARTDSNTREKSCSYVSKLYFYNPKKILLQNLVYAPQAD